MQIYFSGFLVGGLLICALIVLLALRFLIHKRTKVDSIVMAAPFALVFSIFYLFAYGVNLFSLCILIFAKSEICTLVSSFFTPAIMPTTVPKAKLIS